jgi:hypothetical protein
LKFIKGTKNKAEKKRRKRSFYKNVSNMQMRFSSDVDKPWSNKEK